MTNAKARSPQRSFAIRISTLAIGSVLQAGWTLLYARMVGPGSLGVFSTVLAIATLGGTLFSFGLGPYTLRLVTTDDSYRLKAATATMVRLATTILMLVVGVAITTTTLSTSIMSAYVALAAFGAETLTDLSQSILSGQRRYLRAGAFLVVQRCFPLVGLMVGAALGGAELGLVVALGLSGLLALVPLWPLFPSRLGIARTFKAAKFYWTSSLAAKLSQLELVLLSGLGGAEIAGLYSAATRVVSPVNLALSALMNVMVPEMTAAQTLRQRRLLFQRIRKLALLACLLMIAVSYPLSLIGIVFLGPAYQGATWLIAGFVVGAGISGVSAAYLSVLYSLDRAGRVTVAIGTGTIVGLLLVAVTILMVGPGYLGIVPIVAQGVILAILHIAYKDTLSSSGEGLHNMDESPVHVADSSRTESDARLDGKV